MKDFTHVNQKISKLFLTWRSGTACGHLTRDITVLSHDFAFKTKSDLTANRRPQNKSNELQIRRISEQVITGHNTKT